MQHTEENVFLVSIHSSVSGLQAKFASPFSTVTGIHMVRAFVPMSRYHVEEEDRRVLFGDSPYDLDVGIYTPVSFQDMFCRVCGEGTCVYSQELDSFTFSQPVKGKARLMNTINQGGRHNFMYPHTVRVRCMEVEEHMLRTRSHEIHNTGIADVTCGQHLRVDYTVPKNSFHPIGKLTGLTLFLEDEYGEPYPLHGMNCYFLLELRYRVAKHEVPEGYMGTLAPYDPRSITQHLPQYDSDED